LVGKSPTLVFIAGVIFLVNRSKEALLIKTSILGVVQNTRTGFAYNSKPNLNLEYTMNHVNFLGYVQKVTLYQVGDLNRYIIPLTVTTYSRYFLRRGSFNTLLDAVDESYCTFEGGDDPAYDPVYPDEGGYNCMSTYCFRAVSTSLICH